MTNTRFGFLANLSLLIFSSVITLTFAFAIAEGYAWRKWNKGNTWHDPNTQFDPLLGWSPIPSNSLLTWGGINSNSFGARSNEPDPNKDSILVVGDSVAWGYGVQDSATVSSYLSTQLDNRYDVQNFAVSGYGIGQVYLRLQQVLTDFPKTKYVVYPIYTGNDLIDTASNASYGKRKPLFVARGDRLDLLESPISKFCFRNLVSTSFFLRRVEQWNPRSERVLSRLAGDITLSTSEVELSVRLLLRKISQLAEAQGARVIFVLSPQQRDFSKLTSDFRLLTKILKDLDLEYSSPLGPIKADSRPLGEFYFDNAHYSSIGNRFLARHIAKRITRDESSERENNE